MEMRDDDISKAALVHLTRNIEAAGGKDCVYLKDIIDLHPELGGFIHEHVFANALEHVVLSAFIFNLPIVQTCFIKDAHFQILCYVTKHGNKLNMQKHVASIMAKVLGNDEAQAKILDAELH